MSPGRLLLLSALLMLAAPARADRNSEDRLRDQLRNTITQLRALTQENASLKVQLAQAQARPVEDPGKAQRLQHDIQQLRGEREALQAQLTQRGGELQQLQEAQQSAQQDYRRLQSTLLADHRRAEAADAALAECVADNRSLLGVVDELALRYQNRGFADVLLSREPLTGLRQAQLEQTAQRYRDQAATLRAGSKNP